MNKVWESKTEVFPSISISILDLSNHISIESQLARNNIAHEINSSIAWTEQYVSQIASW